ncbi:hypothetical protein C8R30_15310 [Nitrosomonas nitrosa]|uniref:hypothetical protein n=1 Tax=Nitrosomonas nitrosa TaxID=52442 RepID=UPI000D30E05F|nr:hypothetical protein [Nitrosomonas nitrosa]PTQ88353.1 hypothetical protein C8R30_15310 [Nitrosomonas nitrosa]
MTLKSRIEALEQRSIEDKPPKPGLVYFSDMETEAEARQRYEQQHGYPLPDDIPIVRINSIDMSK